MISESIWKRQNSILEEDASNISSLKKQINKQTEIDAFVQLSITEKIQNLKQSATVFAKKLENEKHRNQELQCIIKYMKDQMEVQRMQEASFRDNMSSQNIASLDNKLKKLQYDLGQINSKTNRIVQNVDEKKNKISQNRLERVIDSGIFRNIEKELAESELTFKKLLIEKVRYQKEYQKLVQQYEQLKVKAKSYISKDLTKIQPSNENILHERQDEIINKIFNKFNRIESRRQTKGRAVTIKCQNEVDYNEEKGIIVIKKLLSRTGLTSSNELIYLFQNVNDINQRLYNQMNNYADEMNQIERYLAQAKQKSKGKTNFYTTNSNQDCKRTKAHSIKLKKEQIKQAQTQIESQLQQLFNFFQSGNIIQLSQVTNTSLPPLQQHNITNIESFIQTLQLLEKNIHQFIYCQNHKQKKKTIAKAKSSDLQELIIRVKKNEEFTKVMKKQDFQEQYHKITKNLSQKNLGTRPLIKKKSNGIVKK